LPYVVRIVPRGGGHPGYHPVDAKRGRTDHRTGCQGRLSPTTIPSASGRCSICWLVRPGNRLSIRVLQSASLPSISQVVDQANCIFMVNPKTENGRLVGEVFHLNNVQIDRISIQPWENISGRWIQVELRGASTVYEYTGAYNIDTTNPVMTREQQETIRGLVTAL